MKSAISGLSYVSKVRVRVSRIRELDPGVYESENRVRKVSQRLLHICKNIS